jgi:hypothetical protein
MAKAELSMMEQLHELLASTLKDQINKGVNSEDGIAPAMLSVARQFLKDNHIETAGHKGDASEIEKALDDMNSLPYPGETRPQ